jgi:RNA polymerase sigma-70 factor (ECF subfamily)
MNAMITSLPHLVSLDVRFKNGAEHGAGRPRFPSPGRRNSLSRRNDGLGFGLPPGPVAAALSQKLVTFPRAARSSPCVDIVFSTFAFLPVNEPTDTGSDTAAWVARVRDGDEAAARRLFARLHPLVARIVRAHLPRRSSPEDLVQATLVKVFTRLDQYAGKVPLEHWVARIAVNTCLSQIKAERARPEWRWADLSAEQAAVLERLEVADEPPPAHALAARETVALLLDALSPADRAAVTLFYLEHRSVAEISRLTGSRAVTIRVRLMRARHRMARMLKQLGKGGRP